MDKYKVWETGDDPAELLSTNSCSEFVEFLEQNPQAEGLAGIWNEGEQYYDTFSFTGAGPKFP